MIRLVVNGFGVAANRSWTVLLASVVGAGLTVATPVLAGSAIDSLSNGGPAVVTQGSDTGVYLTALLITIVLGGMADVVAYSQVPALRGALDNEVLNRLSRTLAGGTSLRHLDDPSIADAVQLVRSRYWDVGLGHYRILAQIVPRCLTLLFACSILALHVAWWFPIPIAGAVILAGERTRRLITSQADVWVGQTEDQKHAQYAFEQSMRSAAKDIRVFGLQNYIQVRIATHSTAALKPYWSKRYRDVKWNLSVQGLRAIVASASVGYVAWLASVEALTAGQLTTSVPLIIGVANTDVWMIGMTQRSAVTLSWLEKLCGPQRLDIEDGPSPSREKVQAQKLPESRPRDYQRSTAKRETPPEIVFDSVSFHYPGSSSPVLNNLSLSIGSGETVALVGLNGSGKSTLVKLLLGGYQPTSGRVLIDRQNLSEMSEHERSAWQRSVAIVTQDFLKMPLAIGDNVELGSGQTWSGVIDDLKSSSKRPFDHLDRIGRYAGLDTIVPRLPMGWATPLDSTMPSGQDLSGGEWQRVALARAMRAQEAGAKTLVLDEPAASLDIQGEVETIEQYMSLADSLTSLVISHRFSVVRAVPKICVIERGTIVESGSHDQLMSIDGGRYRKLFGLQAERYKSTESPEANRC